jgi:putative ATP-dependent endonuclease of the OLD family
LLLNPFFLSLDSENRNLSLLFKYEINEDKIGDFLLKLNNKDNLKDIFNEFKEFFEINCFSIEKEKVDKCKIEDIRKLINFKYIRASRGITEQNSNNISCLARDYYEATNKEKEKKQKFEQLEQIIKETNKKLTGEYKTFFKDFFNSMESFNFKDLKEKNNLTIKSDAEYDSLITNNSKIFYQNGDGDIEIPEGHNGLGYTNLLFLCLKIKSFCDEFRNEEKSINLLFIEEPEAHMHPQMQYTFIKHIKDFIKSESKNINIQLIITTHSPYIISEAKFTDLKYFNIDIDKELKVKNCSELETSDKLNIKFVKKYLTLHKYEMFFADYIILVEGTTEKILLPYFMNQINKDLFNKNISIIEIGGAYAHKFKKFIEFLNIKTLIITDIDYKTESEKTIANYEDVKNSETTNQTLIEVTGKKIINDILEDITKNKDKIWMISTQTTNNGLLARSFEEAFIECNYNFFKENYTNFSTFKTDKKECLKDKITKIFKEEQQKFLDTDISIIKNNIDSKIDFALDILFYINEDTSNIIVPKYLDEGIKWLMN